MRPQSLRVLHESRPYELGTVAAVFFSAATQWRRSRAAVVVAGLHQARFLADRHPSVLKYHR